MESKQERVVLVTGLSGSGKSIVLRVFEDLGYETIDNLPTSFLSTVIQERIPHGPLAIQIDSRTRGFNVDFLNESIAKLRQNENFHFSVLFLECDENVIEQRYRETRRQHPLGDAENLFQGIQEERKMLQNLKSHADIRIDSSLLTPPELKRHVRLHFAERKNERTTFHVQSFSFVHGIPREADFVFDMRFIKNPFYEGKLRHLTGEAAEIQTYLERQTSVTIFFDRLFDLFSCLLPAFDQDGRAHLTIAFGCTGGRHRSVYAAEKMNLWLKKQGAQVHLTHREIL